MEALTCGPRVSASREEGEEPGRGAGLPLSSKGFLFFFIFNFFSVLFYFFFQSFFFRKDFEDN